MTATGTDSERHEDEHKHIKERNRYRYRNRFRKAQALAPKKSAVRILSQAACRNKQDASRKPKNEREHKHNMTEDSGQKTVKDYQKATLP